MTKKTIRQYYEEILSIPEIAQNKELSDFINGRIEKAVSKSAEKKPTERQKENAVFAELIHGLLGLSAEGVTISELKKLDTRLTDMSTQRIAPILNGLIKENKAQKLVVKGVNYYKQA